MNESFCILPWLHIQTQPNGLAYPCCQYSYKSPVGDVNKNSLNEIANSSEMKFLRKDMMNGTIREECATCNKNSKDKNNMKNDFNNYYKDIIPDLIKNTDDDGYVHDWKLQYVNIRYSNLCNFSCRTCGPDNSSLWADENNLKEPVVNITSKVPNYVENILNKLPEINRMNFTGGEALLVDENWQILDELIKRNLTNMKISVITNLSKIQYKNRNLIEYAKKFKNFFITVSLDGIKERAELYRNGTNWNVMENNLKELMKHDINFKINCTVGAMNIWHVSDTEKYLLENNLIRKNKFSLSNLVFNPFLSSKILPINFKNEVSEKIDTHKLYLQQLDIDTTKWDVVKNYMFEEDHSFYLKTFIKYNKILDKKRHQTYEEVFPELKNLL